MSTAAYMLGVQLPPASSGYSFGIPKVDFYSPDALTPPGPFYYDSRYTYYSSSWLTRLQAWLLKKIAGKRSVVMNVDIDVGSRIYMINGAVIYFHKLIPNPPED